MDKCMIHHFILAFDLRMEIFRVVTLVAKQLLNRLPKIFEKTKPQYKIIMRGRPKFS
jgi:hypothetical protein